MSTHLPTNEDELLNEPTDELPVLLEASVVEHTRFYAVDDTGELADKTTAVAALDAALADARRVLAARDAETAELRDTLAARDAELEAVHAEIAAVRTERDAASAALAAAPTPDQSLRTAQDELAALAMYIENRRAHWDELEARCARQERRIAELDQEVEQRRQRQRAAEELAASETAQAIQWRAELAAALRDRKPSAPGANRLQLEEPERSDSVLERLRHDLAEAYGRLAQGRNDVARLERALGDKDRGLAARDERIAHLELELASRFAPLPALAALSAAAAPAAHAGAPAPAPEARAPDRPAAAAAPELVVVNGEPQHRYTVAKPVMTIGRAPQCDIQVLTQFVSREHARLFVDGVKVVVEDLGSTNGVFVNAIRIERHRLAHGDLLTIGETQFRFFETPMQQAETLQ